MSSCHQVWPDTKIIVLGNICGAQLLYDSDNGDLNPAKISWWRIFLFSNIQNLKLIFGSMLIMDVGDVTIFKSPTSPCHQFLFLAYMEILYYKKIHWNEFFSTTASKNQDTALLSSEPPSAKSQKTVCLWNFIRTPNILTFGQTFSRW